MSELNVGTHRFGEGVEEREETPLEKQQRQYREDRESIDQSRKRALAALAKKHQKERDKLNATYDAMDRANQVRGGFRKPDPEVQI